LGREDGVNPSGKFICHVERKCLSIASKLMGFETKE
jgi:hypothetical protein